MPVGSSQIFSFMFYPFVNMLKCLESLSLTDPGHPNRKNLFIFTYISAKQCLHQKLAPPQWQILDTPLSASLLNHSYRCCLINKSCASLSVEGQTLLSITKLNCIVIINYTNCILLHTHYRLQMKSSQ